MNDQEIRQLVGRVFREDGQFQITSVAVIQALGSIEVHAKNGLGMPFTSVHQTGSDMSERAVINATMTVIERFVRAQGLIERASDWAHKQHKLGASYRNVIRYLLAVLGSLDEKGVRELPQALIDYPSYRHSHSVHESPSSTT